MTKQDSRRDMTAKAARKRGQRLASKLEILTDIGSGVAKEWSQVEQRLIKFGLKQWDLREVEPDQINKTNLPVRFGCMRKSTRFNNADKKGARNETTEQTKDSCCL